MVQVVLFQLKFENPVYTYLYKSYRQGKRGYPGNCGVIVPGRDQLSEITLNNTKFHIK